MPKRLIYRALLFSIFWRNMKNKPVASSFKSSLFNFKYKLIKNTKMVIKLQKKIKVFFITWTVISPFKFGHKSSYSDASCAMNENEEYIYVCGCVLVFECHMLLFTKDYLQTLLIKQVYHHYMTIEISSN